MKKLRLVACLAALPTLITTSGCDPATIQLVIQAERVQAAALWVAEQAAIYFVKTVALPALFNAFSTEAKVATPENVARGVSHAATGIALDDMVAKRDGNTVELKFTCVRGEDKDTCTQRFTKQLLEVSVDRATRFDTAFLQCKQQAKDDSSAIDVVRQADRMEQCVADAGFAEQVATIKLLYGRG